MKRSNKMYNILKVVIRTPSATSRSTNVIKN